MIANKITLTCLVLLLATGIVLVDCGRHRGRHSRHNRRSRRSAAKGPTVSEEEFKDAFGDLYSDAAEDEDAPTTVVDGAISQALRSKLSPENAKPIDEITSFDKFLPSGLTVVEEEFVTKAEKAQKAQEAQEAQEVQKAQKAKKSSKS
eukprot:Lankesteria_metandrocarpae@DN3996_c0_g1_i2.p2